MKVTAEMVLAALKAVTTRCRYGNEGELWRGALEAALTPLTACLDGRCTFLVTFEIASVAHRAICVFGPTLTDCYLALKAAIEASTGCEECPRAGPPARVINLAARRKARAQKAGAR